MTSRRVQIIKVCSNPEDALKQYSYVALDNRTGLITFHRNEPTQAHDGWWISQRDVGHLCAIVASLTTTGWESVESVCYRLPVIEPAMLNCWLTTHLFTSTN